MSGIIITEKEKAYLRGKTRQHRKWLKWLEDTCPERTKLFKEALARGKLISVKEEG